MVQLDDGRYGAQYDQTLVDQLYASGLSELLTDSIEAMESPRTVTQEVWQQAIAQSGPWVFYDFLYNVSFTAQSGQGEGRPASSSSPPGGGRADVVYYYNEETGDYYAGQIQDATRHPAGLPGWAAAQRRAVRLRGAGTGPGAGALWHPPGPAPHHHGVHRRQPRGLLGGDRADRPSGCPGLQHPGPHHLRVGRRHRDAGGVGHPAHPRGGEDHLPRLGQQPGPVPGPLPAGEGPADQGGGGAGPGHRRPAGGGADVLPVHRNPGGRDGGAHLLLPGWTAPKSSWGGGLGGPVRLFRQCPHLLYHLPAHLHRHRPDPAGPRGAQRPPR